MSGNRGSGKGGNRKWADDAWYRMLLPCQVCGAGLGEQCHVAGNSKSKRSPHSGRERTPQQSKGMR